MLTQVDINFEDVEALAKDLDLAPPIISREIRQAMQQSLSIIKPLAVAGTPVGVTGHARQSISQETRGNPLTVLRGRIFMAAQYGLPLEHGRRPGKMPPVDVIEIWVRRKLGIAGEESRSVAFLIARAIGRRGTRGAHMFDEAFQKSGQQVLNLWRGVPDRIVEKLQR